MTQTEKHPLKATVLLTLGLFLGAASSKVLSAYLYLHPTLRSITLWLPLATAISAVALCAFWTLGTSARESRKARYFFAAILGADLGILAPALLPLAGGPTETTVSLRTNIHGGPASSRAGCWYPLVLADDKGTRICLTKPQRDAARSGADNTGTIKVRLSGWGNGLAMYYTATTMVDAKYPGLLKRRRPAPVLATAPRGRRGVRFAPG